MDRVRKRRLVSIVEPMAIAAPIMIRFLTMYWPSSVKPHGNTVKHTSGSSAKGKNVPGI